MEEPLLFPSQIDSTLSHAIRKVLYTLHLVHESYACVVMVSL